MQDIANWQNAKRSPYISSKEMKWWRCVVFRDEYENRAVTKGLLIKLTKNWSLQITFRNEKK